MRGSWARANRRLPRRPAHGLLSLVVLFGMVIVEVSAFQHWRYGNLSCVEGLTFAPARVRYAREIAIRMKNVVRNVSVRAFALLARGGSPILRSSHASHRRSWSTSLAAQRRAGTMSARSPEHHLLNVAMPFSSVITRCFICGYADRTACSGLSLNSAPFRSSLDVLEVSTASSQASPLWFPPRQPKNKAAFVS